MNSKCGFECLRWYPKWLQNFANEKCYVILYSLLGMLWHTMNSYFIGTLSTIERNFQMSGQMLGLITGATELGGMLSNLLLTYYVAKKHPIRCVSVGMFLIGTCCLMKALPHFFSNMGSSIKMYTKEYENSLPHTDHIITSNDLISKPAEQHVCNSDDKNSDILVFYLFVVTNFFIGIGNTLYWTCGIAYMDDNSSKKAFPVLFSVTLAIRFFGQTAGYVLSSYTLQTFVYTNLTPTINNRDPKWIGAWWVGWFLIGAWYYVVAGLFSLFPRQLPAVSASLSKSLDSVIPPAVSVKDFFVSFKRIIQNKVIFCDSVSSTFYSLGLAAYSTFLPKYMESQFDFTAAKSNLILGMVGILSKVSGILVNGVMLSLLKPTARYLLGFNIGAEILSVLGHLSYIFLGCAPTTLHGHWNKDHSWNVTEECNAIYPCSNEFVQYSPVCDLVTNTEYFSPCHAGCSEMPFVVNGSQAYIHCNCISGDRYVFSQQCPTECASNITIFIIVLTCMKFLRGTVRSIKPLIKMRCVDKADKTMTIGISQSVLQLMGLMPAPIIYGMIMDYSCIVWDTSCGVRGQCSVYDERRLRYLLNFTATGFLLTGVVIDCFIWCNFVSQVKMFDEEMPTTIGEVNTNGKIIIATEDTTKL